MMRAVVVCVLVAAWVVALPAAIGETPPNPFCPVLPSEKAVPDFTIEHNGRVIAFCCESCIEKFRANPMAYLAQLPTTPPPPVAQTDTPWHWWHLFYWGETAVIGVMDHPIFSYGMLGLLMLGLTTRVRRRTKQGVREWSRVALVARWVWQPFPVLMIFLTILAVDLAYSWHSSAAITAFLREHRLLSGTMIAVYLLGMSAHVATQAGLWADRRMGRILTCLGQPGAVLLLLALGISGILWQELAATRQRAQASQTRAEELGAALKSASPNPLGWAWPQAFHQLPRGVHNTYYRGNDERSDKLFNKGNYRTATFRISLQRESGNRADVGEALKDVPLAIRWEIDRGPKTADNFFSIALMEKSFITNGYGPDAKVIPATIVEPAQRWRMDMPIGSVSGKDYQALRGVFYCCLANGKTQSLETSIVHYYIQYILHFQDGVLLPESTVWMVPVYPSPILHGPTADGEWFSDRPIPEITGENTQDPKLLGIPGAQ
ncbi:MAG: hypothetical protein LC104_02505 [Bacteroidales bacterium]|nr:hypothetical protein [Bacteroidales bacterium]